MKKILGVVGSPRKGGNTYLLMEKILSGARDKGAITKIIFLNDLIIKECDGCHLCWIQSNCSKRDDMIEIYPEIIESDILIFGTPVYWYGPTALMKGFIDRFIYFNYPENRKGIRGKRALIVIPFEEEKSETVEPVCSFFERSLKYLEIDLIGKLIVPGVTHRGEVGENHQIMEEAYQLGRTIV